MAEVSKNTETNNGALLHPPPPAEDLGLLSALIQQNETVTKKLGVFDEEISQKQSRLDELQAELESLKSKVSNVEREADEIDQCPDMDNRNAEEIQSLLATYERLRLDERQFKETCNEELHRLQGLASQTEDEETPQNEIEAQLQRAKSRLEAGKVELGAVNRKLALLQRQIDQVPNRTELREYRLRFSELYNQVSATHRQTKHFFSLYNSLEDTKRYLEKELSLLNSIIDSYHQVSHTPSGRGDFHKQLSAIHEGMTSTCEKVDKCRQTERLSVEKLQQELQRLLDQKVAYEKCLKELEAECKTNDRLLATLKKREASQT